MKFKQSLLLTLATLSMLISTSSHAGVEGISFYYGLGTGAASSTDGNPLVTGALMIGFEEEGWSIEAIAFGGAEASSESDNISYSIGGTDIGLAYRTIEKNNRYYKFKASSIKMDFNLSGSDAPADSTFKTSNGSLSFGIGWRVSRENRLEFDYTYYKGSFTDDTTATSYYTDTDQTVHMITARFIWGGSAYHGKGF